MLEVKYVANFVPLMKDGHGSHIPIEEEKKSLIASHFQNLLTKYVQDQEDHKWYSKLVEQHRINTILNFISPWLIYHS